MAPDERLTRVRRLRQPAQFKQTFATGARARSGPFLAIFSASAEREPRLGLAIAKRHAPRAVERNRVKRQLREDFRRRMAELPCVDCVIALTGPTRAMANAELRDALDSLWQRVSRKCDSSSFS